MLPLSVVLVMTGVLLDSTKPTQSGQVFETASALMSGKSRGSFVGDFCDDVDQCSAELPHTVCNVMTQKCECDPHFPIVVDNAVCVPPLKLGDQCLYDQSCHYFDRNAVCGPVNEPGVEAGTTECQCREEFQPSITLESITRTSICIPAPHGPWLKSDVPTIIGLGVGMSIFMALTCLVLKLFSRARFAQEQRARGYGNAHLAPAGSLTTHQSNNAHSEGKHAHRQSYHRQISITESEAADPAGARRTNSISNGGHHSRTPSSFHGRRQSSGHSGTSPMRSTSAKDHPHHNHPDVGGGSVASSAEQLHPLQEQP